MSVILERDQDFESGSLQQGVSSDLAGYAKGSRRDAEGLPANLVQREVGLALPIRLALNEDSPAAFIA